MSVAVVDDLCIPIVINDGDEDRCYFVSPMGHYVGYAREEIVKHMPRNAVSLAFIGMLTALGGLAPRPDSTGTSASTTGSSRATRLWRWRAHRYARSSRS